MSVRVNMSDKEARARDFEPFRKGMYWCKIFDVEATESQSEKNSGKPMYVFVLKVQDTEEYEGSTIRVNATLWDGALYNISAILKALGYKEEDIVGQFDVPDPEWFVGKDIIVRMALGRPSKDKDPATNEPLYPAKIEPKGFRPYYEGFKSQISSEPAPVVPARPRSPQGEGRLLP